MSRPLSSRQEAFARHFCATGNAADAARRAGYAVASARQTGHDLLTRPWVIDRIRRIRNHWRKTAQSEAAILLDRLEQAWDAAVASGSASQMLQVIRLQADVSGLSRKGQAQRADLWDLPADLPADLQAADDGEPPEDRAPLQAAVRRARVTAERRLARHRVRARREIADPSFSAVAHTARLDQCVDAVEARRRLLQSVRHVAGEQAAGEQAAGEQAAGGQAAPDKSLHSGTDRPTEREGDARAGDFRKGDQAIIDAAEAGYLTSKAGRAA